MVALHVRAEPSEADTAIRVIDDGPAPAFRVVGEVDLASAPELRQALALTLAVTAGPVVVDLSDTTFIDASGLGTLVWFANTAERRGRSVSLRGVSASALMLLQITGLAARFGLPLIPPGAAPRRTAGMPCFSMPVG